MKILIINDEEDATELTLCALFRHLPQAQVSICLRMEDPRLEHRLPGWESTAALLLGWNELSDEEIHGFDVAILDWTLHGWDEGTDMLDGRDILYRLRARGFGGRILANSSEPECNRKLLAAGADEVAGIGKALAQQIERLLGYAKEKAHA